MSATEKTSLLSDEAPETTCIGCPCGISAAVCAFCTHSCCLEKPSATWPAAFAGMTASIRSSSQFIGEQYWWPKLFAGLRCECLLCCVDTYGVQRLKLPGTPAVPTLHLFFPESLRNKIPLLTAANEGRISDVRVLVYYHGGGFVVGQADSFSHVGFISYLASKLNAVVVSVNYALAPESPFPKGVQDGVNAYKWVISKVSGSSVTLAGDSAGASVALEVGAQARDEKLELPAGIALISPWVDLSEQGFQYSSWNENRRIDYISEQPARLFAKAYSNGQDPKAVSPIRLDLNGLPPLFIAAGEFESFKNQIEALYEKAKNTNDLEVEYFLGPDMPHAYLLFKDLKHTTIKTGLKKLISFLTKQYNSASQEGLQQIDI
eukprot:m.9767 g.9767  ORF g.9767 m.9767 type:complete len:377 (+) comp4129_c0_seq1:149-1279(+)